MLEKPECQICKGRAGVEKIVVFDTRFICCAYCRHDALEILQMSYSWERQERRQERSSEFGHAIVLDGHKEIFRRGFGMRDHE